MPDIHHRKSIRLKGYDYTQSGAYFVTICVQNRLCLFGRITEGIFEPNDAGIMIQTVCNEMPNHYEGVEIGAFIVMPNHIHVIIEKREKISVGAGPRACPVETTGPRACPVETTGPRACPMETTDPRACPVEMS